ncbi:MAG TPA: ABC-2 family transporter protein [Pirellulales bacterium]|jgi:ABC-2 type transport system permease protein|nr:ABC-2 family transporter protein [Pirellulales bacterium]
MSSSPTIPSTAAHLPDGIIARLYTWRTILRISIEERLIYRGDFMLGTLMRFLPMVAQIFLWSAVFAAVAPAASQAPGAAGDSAPMIAGFRFTDFIAYYLLAMIGRAFSSMPGLATGIANSIRDGTIKKYLIQPVDMIGFLLLQRVAHKLVYYMVAILPFALVFYLCRGYFETGWPDAGTFLAFLASLVMAFLLGYYLETAIGLVGFWFLEVSSFLFIYMLISFFLSGQMFPLAMLDKFTIAGSVSFGDVVRCTPLQYLAYFPATVFLGKVQGARLIWGLVAELGWLVFFIILCRVGFNRGVRRYSAFGG